MICRVRFLGIPYLGAESAEEDLSSVSGKPSTVVRVDLARLDELIHMVGELVISRVCLEEQSPVAARGNSGRHGAGRSQR